MPRSFPRQAVDYVSDLGAKNPGRIYNRQNGPLVESLKLMPRLDGNI